MTKAREIADWMFKVGTEETMSGNYCFYFEDINEKFGTNLPEDAEMVDSIVEEMWSTHDMLDSDVEEDCFSWYFCLSDCIGFRRDCTCKICGKKIRQINLGDICQEEWDDQLFDHLGAFHPSVPHGRLWKERRYVPAEDYFEIGENY